MKKVLTVILSLLTVGVFGVSAQVASMTTGNINIVAPTEGTVKPDSVTYWSLGGVGGATFSQVALSNWSAGGDGSLAYNLMFNYNANYKKDRHLWTNRLELAYGMNYSDLKGSQKVNDKIYLASMYGYGLGHNWYLSALLNFSTQFANGFDYKLSPKRKISQFMAPGYLSAGLGFSWNPKKWFTATVSPLMWRATFVLDDDLFHDANGNPTSAYGVKYGKRMLNEIGANVRLEVNYDITHNINLYSRLDLFSNYLHKPQNVDVRWTVAVTAAINKWLSTNLTLNMIYDDDIKFPTAGGRMVGSKLQIKEVLGIGLQATF